MLYKTYPNCFFVITAKVASETESADRNEENEGEVPQESSWKKRKRGLERLVSLRSIFYFLNDHGSMFKQKD
jgi:hypothetical protein